VGLVPVSSDAEQCSWRASSKSATAPVSSPSSASIGASRSSIFSMMCGGWRRRTTVQRGSQPELEPSSPYSWDALTAGITLVAGIVLPFAYPPLRRGIRESPRLKAGANALLGAPGSATDQ
jgi:hypothetical protein